MKEVKTAVSQPQQALNLYLEDLLLQVPELWQQDVDEAESAADILVAQPPVVVDAGASLISEVVLPEPEPEVMLVEPAVVVASPVAQTVETSVSQVEIVAQAAVEAEPIADNDINIIAFDWQQDAFDCLLFEVGGLNLAIPMVMLGTIHTKGDLSSLFGQPSWLMGLMKLGDQQAVRLVDSAQIFLEHRYLPHHSKDFRYAISLYGSHWALACHQVLGSRRIERQQVKWRLSRDQRPWLVGTIKEEMCALVDIEALCQFRLK